MNNYTDFLNQTPYPILDVQTGIQIYDRLLAALPDNEDANDLLNDFYKSLRDYAQIRGNWLLIDREERINTDRSRTMRHDSVITNVNMMKRYLDSIGTDTSFMDVFECEDERTKRKMIGDFACIVFCLMGIEAR